jgi:hypothetical protein
LCDLGCNRFADFRRLDLSELLESKTPTVLDIFQPEVITTAAGTAMT